MRWVRCVALLAWLICVCQWAIVTFVTSDLTGRRPRRTLAARVRERRQPSPRPRESRDGLEFTDPRVSTSRVKQAGSVSDVLGIMRAEHENPEINLISVSAAWIKLAKRQRSKMADVATHSYSSAFVGQTQSLLEKPTGQAREVANIFWATAKLQNHTPDLPKFLESLVRAAKQITQDMNAQAVSNVIWAVATHSSTNADLEALLGLLPALAARVRAVVSVMNSQDVANVIWSVAELSRKGVMSDDLFGLLPMLADRIPHVTSGMTEQAVSNVIWAAGQLSVAPGNPDAIQGLREMLPTLLARASAMLPSAPPRFLANTCWGLALSKYNDADFLEAVAGRVADEASEWHTRGAALDLPELLCALARLNATGQADMLTAVSKKLSQMLGRLNDWGLCAVSWSYQDLDRDNRFVAFWHGVTAEVTRRGFSEKDVEHSRLGPEWWSKVHGGLWRS
ncbi:unnamed protein product [Effrenium voratum]|nr:unnamed protein product [Effrenium voratum]